MAPPDGSEHNEQQTKVMKNEYGTSLGGEEGKGQRFTETHLVLYLFALGFFFSSVNCVAWRISCFTSSVRFNERIYIRVFVKYEIPQVCRYVVGTSI